MSFIDKIKNVINIPDDDYYDESVDEDYGMPGPIHAIDERPRRSSRSERTERTSRADRGDSRYDSAESFARLGGSSSRAHANQDPNKIVNIHTTTQLQVVLVKPERFDEAAEIADNLNEKRTVVLNLEGANRDVARRLVDFLSGVAYANSGQIKRVANSTFIITPYNVDVMGDLLDELENNGMFF